MTIQGALNKIPKLLQYGVTVTVAAGSYAGFSVSGFTCDPGVQTATGGLSIDAFAALTNSTLATGSATGTATAGSAGSGTTYGTLTDGAATWTVNDLVGRFITTAAPTNTAVVISSNTATTITVVGTWNAPTGATTYSIQDPGAIVTTAIAAPASPTAGASAGAGAILIDNSRCEARNSSMLIRGFRLTNTSGSGILFNDSSGWNFTTLQIRNTSAGSPAFQSGGPTAGLPGASTGAHSMTNIDMLGTGTNYTWGVIGGSPIATNILIRGGAAGLVVGKGFNAAAVPGSGYARPSVTALDVQAATGSPVSVSAGAVTLAGAHLDCSAAGGTAIVVGGTTATTNSPYTFAAITSAAMTTCGTSLTVAGGLSAAEVTAYSGAAATTGMGVLNGGSVSFSKVGVTLTAGTNEINLDSGGLTAAFADVTAGSCVATAPQSSRVCGR